MITLAFYLLREGGGISKLKIIKNMMYALLSGFLESLNSFLVLVSLGFGNCKGRSGGRDRNAISCNLGIKYKVFKVAEIVFRILFTLYL